MDKLASLFLLGILLCGFSALDNYATYQHPIGHIIQSQFLVGGHK
jgi:hypothetical protein